MRRTNSHSYLDVQVMTKNDERPDRMKLLQVADRRWAAFTVDGEYLATLDYEDARPLILFPAARAEFLAQHAPGPAASEG